MCECGSPGLTIDHVTTYCPIDKYEGGITAINSATPDVATWLDQLQVKL